MREAHVLAECAANPDDDAPRLVWADLVGGERGELVVIQCDLARGGLSIAETRARRTRERELLDAHAIEWAAGLPARRWNFRRGFVEAAAFLRVPPLWPWPLLRSISVHELGSSAVNLSGVHALGVERVEDELPVIPHLRALLVHGLESPQSILDLVSAAPITTLRLRMHRMRSFDIETVLGAVPRLVALELEAVAPRDDDGLVLAVTRPLRALQLGPTTIRTLSQILGSRAARTVEHFGFDLVGDPVGLADILSTMPQLRTLDIGGRSVEAAASAIADATLPALELVRIRGEVSPAVLERLDHVYVDVSTFENELVHEHPAALGTLGRPWCEWSKRAVFARLDQVGIIDIPPMPADVEFVIGRATTATVQILSGTVARHHARVSWKDGAHEILDLQSTNGMYIAGGRVQRHVLRDGDDIQMGDALLRYFIGEDARDRAVAFVSGTSTR